jgi:hypothetical protein
MVFDYNDATNEYELVLTDPNPAITAPGVGLYTDNGGQFVETDDVITGITIQPEIDNSILFAAGWGFRTPGGGGAPVPDRVRMEVVTTMDCVGHILNDDPSSAAVDCACTDCAVCPDYPGCVGEVGTPAVLTSTTVVTDSKAGELTFEPPILPSCVAIPQLAAEGASITLRVRDFPDDLTGQVEVAVDDTIVGTEPISPVDEGSVDVAVTLPSGVTGAVRLSSGLTGLAPRADCIVVVTPTPACPDNDADGSCDAADPDDDNDSVADGSDVDAVDPARCRDLDGDGCDDCSSGSPSTSQDGPDYDLDGACDAGDPDDDNDGIPDGSDGEPFNDVACGDADGDRCDDCINGSQNPANDGPDVEGDGLCDFGDPDDDNDGTSDWSDCAPLDGTLRTAAGTVTGVTFAANKVRLSWNAAQFGTATTSDLVRGSGFPVGGAGEVCLVPDTLSQFYDDTEQPATGQLFWYLVRADNACGGGTSYGEESDGTPRQSAACGP